MAAEARDWVLHSRQNLRRWFANLRGDEVTSEEVNRLLNALADERARTDGPYSGGLPIPRRWRSPALSASVAAAQSSNSLIAKWGGPTPFLTTISAFAAI